MAPGQPKLRIWIFSRCRHQIISTQIISPALSALKGTVCSVAKQIIGSEVAASAEASTDMRGLVVESQTLHTLHNPVHFFMNYIGTVGN